MKSRPRRELPLARYIFDRTCVRADGTPEFRLRVTSLSKELPPALSARPEHRLVVEAQCYHDALLVLTEEHGAVVVERRRAA